MTQDFLSDSSQRLNVMDGWATECVANRATDKRRSLLNYLN
jgi:hypothetical protein